MENIKSSKSAYLVSIAKCFIFGLSYLFIKRLLYEVSMFDILAYRFTTAAVTFEILRLLRIIKVDFKNKELKDLFTIACLQPIGYYIFETMGIARTSTTVAGSICALMPLIVVALETLVLKEKTNGKQKAFIVLSVIGVIIITVMSGFNQINSSFTGALFIILALLCEGFFNILSRKNSVIFTPIEITYVMMWFSAIVFNVINIIRRIAMGTITSYFAPMLKIDNLTGVLYLGILASCVAYIMYNYALAKIPASSSAVFCGLTTVIIIISGIIFNNEMFLWYHGVGTVLILCGVWGTNYFSNNHITRGGSYGIKKCSNFERRI